LSHSNIICISLCFMRQAALYEQRDWLDKSLSEVPPNTLTGKAPYYLHNQWDKLVRYLADGRLRMDNNLIENAIRPCSKLATTRLWHTTTLAEVLAVSDADEEELYEAMDWLLARQARIEKKLAARHLGKGHHVLYDVSSSYYEGHTCPLVFFGHSRDGKRGKPILVYGVLTDKQGRPAAVEVYPGNTGDPSTVSDQVYKLKQRFGLERVVLVGDRGMLTQTQIDALKAHPGLGWISALRSAKIRQLIEQPPLQRALFEQKKSGGNRFPRFPGGTPNRLFQSLAGR
jgi:hypothetical protein